MPDLPVLWAKTDVVFKAISSIAIPVALAFVGRQVSVQQQQASANALKMERVEKMVSHLTSSNEKERLLSMRVVSYLANQQEFPPELVEVMIGVARADPAAEVSSSAIETLAAIAQSDSTSPSGVQAQQALQTLPIVLRIHIPDESQREAAKKIEEQAKAEGYVVPSIENVGRKYSPRQTQLRFFHAEDQDSASKLAQYLSTTTPTTVKDFSKDVPHAPSRSLELWMAQTKKD